MLIARTDDLFLFSCQSVLSVPRPDHVDYYQPPGKHAAVSGSVHPLWVECGRVLEPMRERWPPVSCIHHSREVRAVEPGTKHPRGGVWALHDWKEATLALILSAHKQAAHLGKISEIFVPNEATPELTQQAPNDLCQSECSGDCHPPGCPRGCAQTLRWASPWGETLPPQRPSHWANVRAETFPGPYAYNVFKALTYNLQIIHSFLKVT